LSRGSQQDGGPHPGRAGGAAAPLLSRRDRDRMSPEEAVKRMRHYEMMIILDPALEERTIQPSLDQFLKVVTTAGGTVDKVDVWGRRRLAYEIDKKPEGIYTVVDLMAEPEAVKELDRQLNLNEAVLRTKIVRPNIH
jgi:small subunit ribosomal protein S6